MGVVLNLVNGINNAWCNIWKCNKLKDEFRTLDSMDNINRGKIIEKKKLIFRDIRRDTDIIGDTKRNQRKNVRSSETNRKSRKDIWVGHLPRRYRKGAMFTVSPDKLSPSGSPTVFDRIDSDFLERVTVEKAARDDDRLGDPLRAPIGKRTPARVRPPTRTGRGNRNARSKYCSDGGRGATQRVARRSEWRGAANGAAQWEAGPEPVGQDRVSRRPAAPTDGTRLETRGGTRGIPTVAPSNFIRATNVTAPNIPAPPPPPGPPRGPVAARPNGRTVSVAGVFKFLNSGGKGGGGCPRDGGRPLPREIKRRPLLATAIDGLAADAIRGIMKVWRQRPGDVSRYYVLSRPATRTFFDNSVGPPSDTIHKF